ncbi:MAG: hypothetical protein HFG39_08215 [Lachnospiraceae bacterium]|nr:hypothetical protein [Lachnospiraceae bacterium]
MNNGILDMFNTIMPEDYLISNPYSSSCNKVFKNIFKSEDFLNMFYFMSNKTYERLAVITALSNDTTKNTVFITGFRGCGKTCFMNLLSSVISGKYSIPSYDECKDKEMALIKKIYGSSFEEECNKEILDIEEYYNISGEKIIKELRPYLRLEGYQLRTDSINKYINKNLKGKVIFLNFDKGNGKNEKRPFEEKFIIQVQKLIDLIIKNKDMIEKNPFTHLLDFYERNITIIDELLESKYYLFDFFELIKEKFIGINSLEKIKRELIDCLQKLNLEQLIFILISLYISYNICKGSEKKLFFIFDNMDIVYKNNIVDMSMHEYSNFIEDMNSIIQDIDINIGDNDLWVEYYEQSNFIFAMRETTVMQIADQFLDRVDFVVKYFDISMDTDKAYVVEKKINFVNKYRSKIENKDFVQQIDYIHQICTNIYVKKNIFPMFNNDFKRSIFCIANICRDNVDYIEEKLGLLGTNKPYNKNGARGILFRLIYDEFKKEHYFDDIGVEWDNNENSFTPSRIILTVLYNLLPEYERNDEENMFNFERMNPMRIGLCRLYSYIKEFMNEKTFVRSLVGMYNLKNARKWNHLITFDNIKEVTEEELEKVLLNEQKDVDVMIRITCAGTNYIKFICTHYEFFSCRFTNKTLPLFCRNNSIFCNKHKKYNFEYIIEQVYKSVEKCCKNLIVFNEILLKVEKDRELQESEYIFKNKNERKGKLHEERIIHRHITYLDNYRKHLIQDVYPDRVADINIRIIAQIKNYICLLDNKLFGDISKALVIELPYCIKYIKDKDYKDQCTEISRDSYKLLTEKRKDG